MRPVSVIFWSLLGAVIYGFTLGSTDPVDYAVAPCWRSASAC